LKEPTQAEFASSQIKRRTETLRLLQMRRRAGMLSASKMVVIATILQQFYKEC